MLFDLFVHDKEINWTACKCYQDFLELEAELECSHNKFVRVALPSMGCFGIRQRLNINSFRERRKERLEIYLSHLLRQIVALNQCPPLLRFLDCPASLRHRISSPKFDDLEFTPSVWTPSLRSISRSTSSNFGRVIKTCEFKPPFEYDVVNFESHEWRILAGRDPELARLIKKCGEFVRTPARFENGAEEVFKEVRRKFLGMARRRDGSEDEDVLDLAPLDARGFVWEFLALLASSRPFYRRQCAEVAELLETRTRWAEAVEKFPGLYALKHEFLTA